MEICLNKSHGLRNDLQIVLPRVEVDDTLFHIANRGRLMQLPGLVRHVPKQDPNVRRQVNDCKIPVEEHLKLLTERGQALLDHNGYPKRRVIAIGSRNVGNNHGFIAWQKNENPKPFNIQGDPLNYPSYSCLIRHRTGRLAVQALRFDRDRVFDGDAEVTEEVEWCVFANWVLRDGKVVNIEDVIEQFYDIRHVLAFDREREAGRQIEAEIYKDYPGRYRENAIRALRDQGAPRNRYLHNCLGLSDDFIFILQREGTIEEVANWLKDAGAKDGIILDNGGSVFCWAWWLHPKGGFLFTAPDFRPASSAVIAFVLKGPAAPHMPSGSASFSVV
jgi:hypothetical protein